MTFKEQHKTTAMTIHWFSTHVIGLWPDLISIFKGPQPDTGLRCEFPISFCGLVVRRKFLLLTRTRLCRHRASVCKFLITEIMRCFVNRYPAMGTKPITALNLNALIGFETGSSGLRVQLIATRPPCHIN